MEKPSSNSCCRSSTSSATETTAASTATTLPVGHDPMQATEQELKWAVAIKDAAMADPDVNADLVTDLEFLQHALIAKDKVDKALLRLKRMQAFKLEYGIAPLHNEQDSYATAVRDVKAFDDAHPHFVLALGGLLPPVGTDEEDASSSSSFPYHHTHVLSMDYARFLARKMKTSPEAYKVLLRGLFYYMQACQPNMAALRAGFLLVGNTAGVGWRNFSPLAEERCAHLFSDAYPIRVRHLVLMNAHAVLRVMYSIVKVFFSPKLRKTVVFCGDHETFLQSSPYCVPVVLPTAWGGTMDLETMHKMVHGKLRERYKLEASFKL